MAQSCFCLLAVLDLLFAFAFAFAFGVAGTSSGSRGVSTVSFVGAIAFCRRRWRQDLVQMLLRKELHTPQQLCRG